MRTASLLLALVGLLVLSATAAAGSYSGRLDIRHTDDMAHGKSSTRYSLRTGDRRLAVRPALPPSIRSGSRVVVRGRRQGRVVAGDVRPAPGVRAATAGVLGEYRVAVLLVNFADDRSQPWTPAAVASRFFTAGDSLDTYFKEQSYDQVDLAGDVYGWYDLPQNGAGCDVDAWAAAARARATAQGVVLSAYHSIAYVFPDQGDCNWSGLAAMPGRDMWLNGTISQRVAAHELGHNMGVHHASALACTQDGAAVAFSSSCSRIEYGDPFSTMGRSSRRMAGWHLQQLGYLKPANIQTVAADGRYTLRTTATASATEPQLLKLPRATPGEFLYVDLRAPAGVFDGFGIADPAVNGVTIRVGHAPTIRSQSRLIDTTPDSRANVNDDFLDAPLGVGRVFHDGNVAIKTVAVESGVATVDVSWSGPLPETAPPPPPPAVIPPADDSSPGSDDAGPGTTPEPPADATAPLVRIASPGRGATLRRGRTARVRAAASDESGVHAIELYVDGRRVAARRGAALSVAWKLRRVRPGRHLVTVVARDAAGNPGRHSVRVRVRR